MDQYSIALLLKPLVHNVYWNVELISKENLRTPRYWDGNSYAYVGIDQSKCSIAYVRELDDTETVKVDIGGCSPNYDRKLKLRIVVFIRDFSGSKNSFIESLINDLSFREISIKKIISDSNKLVRFESDFGKKLTLMGSDLYIGIDLELMNESNHCCPEVIDNCKKEPTCL